MFPKPKHLTMPITSIVFLFRYTTSYPITNNIIIRYLVLDDGWALVYGLFGDAVHDGLEMTVSVDVLAMAYNVLGLFGGVPICDECSVRDGLLFGQGMYCHVGLAYDIDYLYVLNLAVLDVPYALYNRYAHTRQYPICVAVLGCRLMLMLMLILITVVILIDNIDNILDIIFGCVIGSIEQVIGIGKDPIDKTPMIFCTIILYINHILLLCYVYIDMWIGLLYATDLTDTVHLSLVVGEVLMEDVCFCTLIATGVGGVVLNGLFHYGNYLLCDAAVLLVSDCVQAIDLVFAALLLFDVLGIAYTGFVLYLFQLVLYLFSFIMLTVVVVATVFGFRLWYRYRLSDIYDLLLELLGELDLCVGDIG